MNKPIEIETYEDLQTALNEHRDEIRALVSAWGDPGDCRSCAAVIYWYRTRKGRAMPVNCDGTSHFATCPQASEHRKKGKT